MVTNQNVYHDPYMSTVTQKDQKKTNSDYLFTTHKHFNQSIFNKSKEHQSDL